MSRWDCVFRDDYVRRRVDPFVQKTWKAELADGAPFGALRRIWRDEHCKRINPYGSDDCPYSMTDCANAFMMTAMLAAEFNSTPEGAKRWFGREAKTMAIQRADNKPLARDKIRTDDKGPRDRGATGSGHPPRLLRDDGSGTEGVSRTGMRSTADRPEPLGDLLRTLDLGPHQGRAKDGKEGPK